MAKISLVDKMIKQRSSIRNESLKNALEEHAKQLEAKQAKEILENLTLIDNVTDKLVEQVRDVRKAEKETKKALNLLNEAFEQYKKDADFEAFQDAIRGKLTSYYVQKVGHYKII